MPLHAVKPKLPEDFEANTWAKLRAAVLAVHKRQPVSCSLEELYRVSLHTASNARCSKTARDTGDGTHHEDGPTRRLQQAACWADTGHAPHK